MLVSLIRTAAAALSALAIVCSGMVLATSDLAGLPGASHVATLSVDDSPLPRDTIVQRLDAYAAEHDIRVALVSIDRDDFVHGRTAFEFGRTVAEGATIDWFSPDMHGGVLPSARLEETPLSGSYSLTATEEQARGFATWATHDLGADVTVIGHSPWRAAEDALLTVGAWVPISTALLLIAAIALAWFVIRSRARALSILSGMRGSTVLATDLLTLARAVALPVAMVYPVGLAAAFALGFGRIGELAFVTLVVHAMLGGAMLLGALLAHAITLPSTAAIAERRPVEGSTWFVAETCKIAAVLVTAAVIPLAALSASTATAAASSAQFWTSIDDAVSLRISRFVDEGSIGSPLSSLTRRADADGEAMLGRSLTGGTQMMFSNEDLAQLGGAGFDSIVLVNRTYIDQVATDTGAPLVVDSSLASTAVLPGELGNTIDATLAVWTQDGAVPPVRLLEVAEGRTLHVPSAMLGTTDELSKPLILEVTIDDLDDSTIFSLMTTGNLLFTDTKAIRQAVGAVGLGSAVLSIDRVADLGLWSAQAKQQNAQLSILAAALGTASLIIALMLTAWSFIILRRKSIFVQKVSGMPWSSILARRLMWESSIAALFGAVTAVILVMRAPAWLAAAPLLALAVFALSAIVHRATAARIVDATIARRG